MRPMQPRIQPTADHLNPTPLCLAQTRIWMRFIYNDFWYNNQMPVYETALLRAAQATLDFRDVDMLSDKTIGKISRIVPAVEERKLVLLTKPPFFLWIDPPDPVPRIAKLCHVEHWALFARCASCGDNQFLSVVVNRQEHAACYKCLPPSQYGSIGASAVSRSLILDAVRGRY